MPKQVDTTDGGEELLTIPEAMRELDIGRTAFYRYVRNGKITTIRHGGRSYVARSTMTAYWTRLRDEGLRRKRASRQRAS